MYKVWIKSSILNYYSLLLCTIYNKSIFVNLRNAFSSLTAKAQVPTLCTSAQKTNTGQKGIIVIHVSLFKILYCTIGSYSK